MNEKFQDSPEQTSDSVPSSIEKSTTTVLADPEAAKDAAAEIESKLPKLGESESSDALKGELSSVNVQNLNAYVRTTIDGNNLAGKQEFQLALFDAVSKNPNIE